jgi:hypothetical protein
LDGRGTQEGIFLRTLWTSWREAPQRKKIRPYFAKRRALPHNSSCISLVYKHICFNLSISGNPLTPRTPSPSRWAFRLCA